MLTTKVTTKPCMVCGQRSELEVDAEALARWRGGALVQRAFPSMSPDDRELLISGTHPECWTKLFGEGE